MDKAFCIFLLLVLPWQNFGQTDLLLNIPEQTLPWYDPSANPDSLKTLLQLASDTERVDILCEIAFAMQRLQPLKDDHRKYIDEALKLSEKLDYRNGKLKANYLLSRYYRHMSRDLTASLAFAQKAEDLIDQETHWSMKFRVWSINIVVYGLLNQEEAAVSYYHKMLEQLTQTEAWPAHFSARIGLMRHASINDDYNNLRKYLEEAIEQYEQNYQNGLFYTLKLINEVEELGINLSNYGEYRRAIELMNKVMASFPNHKTKNLYNEFYRAKIHGRIARIYRYWGKYDTALVHFDKSYHLFLQLYNDNQEAIQNPEVFPSLRIWSINFANQLEERAIVLMKKGSLQQAENDLHRSILVRTEHGDPLGIGMCYDRMGELYSIRGNFKEALQWFDSALIIKTNFLSNAMTRIHNSLALKYMFCRESIAATHLKTGRLYEAWNSTDLAREYFIRSHAMSIEAGSHKAQVEALAALGDHFLSLNEPDSAYAYYQQAGSIYEKMENKPGQASIHESLGDLFKLQDRYDDALEKYDFSRHIYTSLEMPVSLAPLLIKVGDVLMFQQKPVKAVEGYTSGLEIATSFDLRKTMMNAHKSLSEAFTINGDIEKAFKHFKSYIELRDELFNLESSLHIAEMETRFESEQNRNMIRILKAEKELSENKEARNRLVILLLAGFSLLLLLWVMLYLRHIKLKNSNELMQVQQKLFRSQMNPHFIFNSLGSIQSSIINEKPIKAARYLSRFSRLMRNILESSHAENVQLVQELATIENYLELQRVRFPEKFDYSITIDDNLNIEKLHIPPMLAQPFIENAIEHGIKNMECKGHISVCLIKKNSALLLEIKDNGIGREKAHELLLKQGSDHKSMATDIIRERIDVLNRNKKHKITFEIIDLKQENGEACGTKVVFGVPL